MEEEQNPVTASLNRKLAFLPNQTELIFSKIELGTETKTLYEPKFVSIGANYRGEERLECMEKIKLCYLRELLDRKSHNVDKYVRGMRRERIPEGYKGRLDDDTYTEMVVVDGLFVIELFRGDLIMPAGENNVGNVRRNLTLLSPAVYHDLAVDLILLHNQIPFPTLTTLFNLTEPAQGENLVSLASSFFRNILYEANVQVTEDDNDQQNVEFQHLLHLLHHIFCRSSFPKFPDSTVGEFEYRIDIGPSLESASELQKAGIEFKRLENSEGFFHVRFENKVFEITTLFFSHVTEKIFRNLIDYELFAWREGSEPICFCHYIKLMDALITSPTDVQQLRQCKIVENLTSRDEDVSNMFKEFSKSVGIVTLHTYYAKVIDDVNVHCARPRNLKTRYCRSPWRIIRIVAAFSVILFAIVQTIAALHS